MFRVGVLCRATVSYALALLSFFILISIGCSGALLLSLVFEMEIKYVMMTMMIFANVTLRLKFEHIQSYTCT